MTDTAQASFADRLRRTRKECGLTRSALAGKISAPKAFIRNIEDGKIYPPLDVVKEVARELGVRPEWLAFGVAAADGSPEEGTELASAWGRLNERRRAAIQDTIGMLEEAPPVAMMYDQSVEQTGPARIRESLADRLRRARKQRGWSQEFLASRADTSQAVIQKIENGKLLRPRNIERIAVALDVRPAWLMFGVNEVEDLDEEAVQVARAWSRLREPERSAMKETIRRLADG